MENKLVITLNKESVFKSTIENPRKFKESFFSVCYKKAFKGIEDIISNSYNNENDEELEIELHDDYNNIIAFLGDRGTGKTSTMKSFAKYLRNREEGIEEYSEIFNNSYFEVMNTIDPSLFTNKDSLVEIIVAEMFKNFKEYDNIDDIRKKQELVKQFEKVFADIRTLNMDKGTILRENIDNIEALIELSSALSLKKDLKELIDLYIGYYVSNKKINKKKIFLVIPIDDLDMNLNVGEKLIEDIRKYLIQSNIIILMAVKFEQLQEIINQKFVVGLKENFKFYSEVYRNSNQEGYNILENFKSEIDEKVEKYLDKLIPYNRRCFMPTLESHKISIKIDKKLFDNIIINDNETINLWELIKLNFYKKLDYIIISEEQYRAIIPKNLRALIELCVLLNSMKDHRYEENLYEIRKYYNEVIISGVGNSQDKFFFKDILYCYFKDIKKRSLIYLNTKILKEIGTSEFKLNDIKDDLKYIDDNKTLISDERITLGDIITWIKIYSTIQSSEKKRKFIEVFKSIYTLRLLHAYHKGEVDIREFVGINLIGKYFFITNNINKYKTYIYGYFSKNTYIFKKLQPIITNNKDEELELESVVPVIFQPAFDKDKYYSRLIRRERKKYNTEKELRGFTNFILYPFNILELKYKNYNDEIDNGEFILNLDCFLSILDLVDKNIENIHNSRKDDNNVINKLMDKFNEINFNKKNICIKDSLDNFDQEDFIQIQFISKEKFEIVNRFFEKYLDEFEMTPEVIRSIDNFKRSINSRIRYIDGYERYKASTIIKELENGKNSMDRVGLQKYEETLDEYLEYFTANKWQDFKKGDDKVEEFKKLLEQIKRELDGTNKTKE